MRLSNLGEDRVLHPYPLKKIAILGMGGSAVDWVKYCYTQTEALVEEGFEVWTVNAAGFAFQSSLNFNMHTIDTLEDKNPKWLKLLKELQVPVAMPCAYEDYPTSMEYPLHEVVKEFNETYFMNGVAYAIAFALLCKVEEIMLFGCDYNYHNNLQAYEEGRSCVEYWLGIARGKGVFVQTGANTSLLDVTKRMALGVYGYGKSQPVFDVEGSSVIGVKEFQNSNVESLPMKEEPDVAVGNSQ